MILNGSAYVLLNLKKSNKQSLKIDPGTHKKLGMLNVIKQLQHFILCNMMCYICMEHWKAILTAALHLGQYCFPVLHNTSYRTQWSAIHVIVYYYMTSDNVFSDWLTSLVTFFDKTLYSTRKKSRELNITFQRSSRHLKLEMVFPILKSSSQSPSG